MGLSVAIPAKNEQRYIAGAIESVMGMADEVVVVLDPKSSDATEPISLAQGARVEPVEFVTFANLRNRSLELCREPWVFFLDADERATPELGQEMARLVQKEPAPGNPNATVGYWIPRHNYFFGKRVGHAGWYPDYQLRLLWRARARYPEEQRVHEVVRLDGQAEKLSGHMLHYNVDTLAEFQAKQRRYAELEAEMLREKGVRTAPHKLVTRPLREFLRRYVALGGWKDGLVGLYLCAAMGYYAGMTYKRLREMERKT